MKSASFLLVLLVISLTESKKVLLLPFMTPSHLLQLGSIGDGLMKRGHEAHMVVHTGQKVPGNILKWGIKIIRYHTGEEELPHNSADFQIGAVNAAKVGMSFASIGKVTTISNKICEGAVRNDDLIRELRKENFDFAIVDGFVMSKCLFVIPHRLGIPYGAVSPLVPFDMFSLTLQVPLLTPIQIQTSFSMTSTFMDRLLTSFAVLAFATLPQLVFNEAKLKSFCEVPFDSLTSLAYRSHIWLIDLDSLVDVPKPMPPNMFNIGGISSSPPLPLEKKFKVFADSATEGLIVITFGGTIGYLPVDYVNNIIQGVAMVNYKVIFRQKTKPSVPVPENLMIVDWMPQNDLLAHRNTRVFVTHCGSNGQHEAVYHGVPMLGLPVHGDQVYNAARLTAKGYGNYLNVNSFTPEELARAIEDVATNPAYRDAIQKASKVFRSRPMSPRDRAAFWVDHVMEHGSDHLQSYTNQLSWYQIILLDLLAFYIILISLMLFVCLKTCRWMKRCLVVGEKEKLN